VSTIDAMLSSVSPERLREVAGAFVTGVTIVTTSAEDGYFGCTANAVASLSLEPPLMLVCLDRAANTHPRMMEARTFVINVIRAGDANEQLSRLFASKHDDKFAGVPYRVGTGGAPILDASLAWLECELDRTYEGGDHTIFVGRVIDAAADEGEPLIFHRGRYSTLGE
jgi:3-hydroxy-9,10-secoandrosta-1,3,5(10)-triene-9,17-dione monooxygenase reductase component